MQKSQETQVRSLGREDPRGGHGNRRQYSCLENPNDRGTGWAAVHGVEKSDTTNATNTHRATVGHLSCSGVGESLLASRGGGSGMLPSLPQRTRRLSSQALLYVDLLRTTSVSSSPCPMRWSIYPHFSDKKKKALSASVTCLRSHSGSEAEWGLAPEQPSSSSLLITTGEKSIVLTVKSSDAVLQSLGLYL